MCRKCGHKPKTSRLEPTGNYLLLISESATEQPLYLRYAIDRKRSRYTVLNSFRADSESAAQYFKPTKQQLAELTDTLESHGTWDSCATLPKCLQTAYNRNLRRAGLPALPVLPPDALPIASAARESAAEYRAANDITDETETCEHCEEEFDYCTCEHCDSCGECSECDNCCSCWYCYSCHRSRSEDNYQCSNCEHCERCCECYYCQDCCERVSEVCSNCEHCSDCCNCEHCEDCSEPVETVCEDCQRCADCGCSCEEDSERCAVHDNQQCLPLSQ